MKTVQIEVTLIDSCGADISVVNAARVSFNKQKLQFDYGKDDKLIKYLAKHKHLSPFNHAFLSFRVKAPVFVARQLVKHKFLPWNEVSRRYVDDEPEYYFPTELRAAPIDKKQGSTGVVDDQEEWAKDVKNQTKYANALYLAAIEAGVCPEQARMVLPQNMMTEWIWSGTLGAFCDMLRLRLDDHTQKETRDVAALIAEKVEVLFPVSYRALLGEV